jgi:DNA-binding GntR family transcriptional regulator
MLDVSLSKVSRPLLRDEAYDRIRRAIVDGTLPPGAPLRDADLADQLGLSKAPVREALRRLADDGLVDSKPQSYTRVSDVMSRDVIDARQIVRVLHEFAVREAASRCRPADVAAMRAANDRFAKAIEAGDIAAAVRADDELHDVPVRLAGNAAVAATLDRYTPLLRRLEHARFSSALAWNSVERHTKLIDALEAHDTGTAVSVISTIWTDLLEDR